MDMLEIENLCKDYFQTKAKIKALEEKFSQIRGVLLEYMMLKEKKLLKVANYSLEIKPRVNKTIDRKAIYSLIEQGKLPRSIITGEHKTMQLYIQQGSKVKLVGNKFVVEK